ncbi:MAG TPA: hypothetical protein VMX17_09340 [Candidatus Glassbacteria bacterium]|nr:hypothetical protein [Candidatus Glassbacteria bacterium]
MKKIKLPNTFRYILPFLLVICPLFVYCFFRWIGFILGIPIAILLNIIIHSILGMRYWNNCRTIYESLIAKNYTKNEALIEISKSAHPELSLSTHTAIINKFNDLNLLVIFITGALPPGNNDDEFALGMLDHTSIQYFGGDRYKVVTKRKWNRPDEKSMVTHQAKYDDIYTFLKHRKHWKELNNSILENLSKIFEGDFSSFNDFVNISEHYSLLKENYLGLAKGFKESKELIPYFALTLERSGARLMELFSKKGDEGHKVDAKKCYELSIKLNPFLIPSYGGLAVVYGHSDNNVDVAIEYCDKGIEVFEELKKTPKEQISYYDRALLLDTSTIEYLEGLKNEFLGKK